MQGQFGGRNMEEDIRDTFGVFRSPTINLKLLKLMAQVLRSTSGKVKWGGEGFLGFISCRQKGCINILWAAPLRLMGGLCIQINTMCGLLISMEVYPQHPPSAFQNNLQLGFRYFHCHLRILL
jgi:hypothetical protein